MIKLCKSCIKIVNIHYVVFFDIMLGNISFPEFCHFLCVRSTCL